MKIALDVMGGDHGPAPAIEGALRAAQECGVEVLLVGDEAIITAECRRLGCTDPARRIRHASQVVEMHESPATVARKKRDSSIWVATELVKSGEASAVVSPGNTGASMVASILCARTDEGCRAPGDRDKPAHADWYGDHVGCGGECGLLRLSIWPNSPSWGMSMANISLGSPTHVSGC